ncbi:protein ELC [Tripterygium wilfordii]|uniref:Protein ELC n=1 Tax=Tripterygium wilfordii TaxID=458696 RepID=A0A7J7CXY2_TRIWF|nr:protein ELC-like [Tripterygium wilfordii]KAF5738878.1 protein ELC [Tripterygium wilfordii]
MASNFSTQFVDSALHGNTSFELSYTDPNQKWIIRNHILSLIQNYPSLSPSMDSFIHNNGSTVNLLKAEGKLSVSPPIPLTIWVHVSYPAMAPMVFVMGSFDSPIHRDHPFVDSSSGATFVPYLQTWQYPRSNLVELVKNLVNLFSIDHPLVYSPTNSTFSHPSMVSKREALDRLAGMVHYDLVFMEAKTEEEIEELSNLQGEMAKRVETTNSLIDQIETERSILKRRVEDLVMESDVVMNWLRVHDGITGDETEDAFEGVDEESKMKIDCLAASMAIDDLIYSLEKAIEGGVLSFEAYIKQVRVLAREQFFCTAMLVKLGASPVVH